MARGWQQALAIGGIFLLVLIGAPVSHAVESTVTVTATVCPQSGCPTPPPPSTGGGGGGNSGGGSGGSSGGNSGSVSGTVTFTGRAYPQSAVTILEDGRLLLSTTAGFDARFQASVQSLPAGSYLFSAYAEDSHGRRSPILNFPVTIASNATILVSGVFLAPTIATDKSEVRQGDPIMILGESAPTSTVTVVLHSDSAVTQQVQADQHGAYFVSFNTAGLSRGEHTATARAAFDNMTTPESRTTSFVVGDSNTTATSSQPVSQGDVTGDGHINLVDFSVEAFWYKRSNPPASVDLNHDGVVNLVDFSIMAFYWTG